MVRNAPGRPRHHPVRFRETGGPGGGDRRLALGCRQRRADRLGYADPTNAMKQHCRGVVKHYSIQDSLGRVQNARVLPEPDLLCLPLHARGC